ncbi:uncharacterized protein F4812DRAFT_455222 [Daldinia caldariorum]|uniref:uncharacterized protein n=1 Tax=Daldinia caldariorum TaxID=326644 RepID=UPI0020072CCB|nr:uncharacterized protein F4812DRAFT_455222 [Daldinia caldariorum]KAI1471109.1 hypothetical protein F4812DRAFT_455222 [Daldinia caldariorum]
MDCQNDSSRVLNIPISTQFREPWFDMMGRAIRFLQATEECNEKSCYQLKDGPNLQDYAYQVRSGARDIFLSHAMRIQTSWEQFLQSGTLEREAALIHEYVLCSRVQSPGETSNSTAVPKSTEESYTKVSPLLNLPCEVFERIFLYVVGRYELKGETLRLSFHTYSGNLSTQLIFYKPRTWGNLAVLQICRAFRNLAIFYYGVPKEESLPFSPQLDTLFIRGEMLDKFGGYNLWLRYDGAYFINAETYGVKPWSKVRKISNECLRRPTEITIDIHNGTIYKECWLEIWYCLGRLFTNARCLKCHISQPDRCFLETFEEEYTEGKEFNLSHDFYALHGLFVAIGDAPADHLFPNLKNLQLVKVADLCTHPWIGWLSSLETRNYMERLHMWMIDGADIVQRYGQVAQE